MMRFDLLDVIKTRIEEAGLGRTFTKQPDPRKCQEPIIVSMGVPVIMNAYFDGEQDVNQSVSVYVKRRNEEEARQVAEAVGALLRTTNLASENGSYSFTSVTTTTAHPFAWDPSGFFIWEQQAQIELTRKE